MRIASHFTLRLILSFLVVSAAGLAFFLSLRLAAHATSPSIILGSNSGPPTSIVTVTGTGFGATEKVLLKVDTTLVGSALTNATGGFSTSITIPKVARPGNHPVFAAGLTSHTSTHVPFVVWTDWPMSGYDPQHSNFNPYENVLSPTTVSGLVLEWKHCLINMTCAPTTESLYPSAVADGLLYANGGWRAERVWALNPATGGRKWAIGPIHRHRVSLPAVVNGVLYLGTGGGDHIVAVNAKTGTMLWNYSLKTATNSDATVANGIVYMSSYGGGAHFLALDATTGALRWKAYSSQYFFGSPTVFNNVVYVCLSNGTLYALNASTGVTLWKLAITGFNLVVANSVLYISSGDGNLYALNGNTGATLWKLPLGGDITAVANGVVYDSETDGNMYALDASTGTTLWTFGK